MKASRRQAHVVAAFVLAAGLAVRFAAAPLPLAAQQGGSSNHADVSVAFSSTTLGFGLQVGKLVTDHFGLRVGGNYFKFSTSATKSDVSYDASLKLKAVTGMVDFFPSARGNFHLTGGIMTNPITVSGTGTPDAQGNFTLNGHTYNTAQVGQVSRRRAVFRLGVRHARAEGPVRVLLRPWSDDRRAVGHAVRHRRRGQPPARG